MNLLTLPELTTASAILVIFILAVLYALAIFGKEKVLTNFSGLALFIMGVAIMVNYNFIIGFIIFLTGLMFGFGDD